VTGTPLWWEPPIEGASTLDILEQMAKKLHEHDIGRSSFHCVSWEELSEDERDDVRHQVRSVLDIVSESQVPGLVVLLPPPVLPPAVAPTIDPGATTSKNPGRLPARSAEPKGGSSASADTRLRAK
jgi:hypothetical protein